MLLGTYLVQYTYMHCLKFQGARAHIAHMTANYYIKQGFSESLYSFYT